MNRQQRRRLGRHKNPTYNITADHLSVLSAQAVDEAIEIVKKEEQKSLDNKAKEIIEEALSQMFYLPMLVLRDDFGYGKQRLKRFAEGLKKKWIFYDDDRAFTAQDIKDIILEETGLEVSFDISSLENHKEININSKKVKPKRKRRNEDKS